MAIYLGERKVNVYLGEQKILTPETIWKKDPVVVDFNFILLYSFTHGMMPYSYTEYESIFEPGHRFRFPARLGKNRNVLVCHPVVKVNETNHYHRSYRFLREAIYADGDFRDWTWTCYDNFEYIDDYTTAFQPYLWSDDFVEVVQTYGKRSGSFISNSRSIHFGPSNEIRATNNPMGWISSYDMFGSALCTYYDGRVWVNGQYPDGNVWGGYVAFLCITRDFYSTIDTYWLPASQADSILWTRNKAFLNISNSDYSAIRVLDYPNGEVPGEEDERNRKPAPREIARFSATGRGRWVACVYLPELDVCYIAPDNLTLGVSTYVHAVNLNSNGAIVETPLLNRNSGRDNYGGGMYPIYNCQDSIFYTKSGVLALWYDRTNFILEIYHATNQGTIFNLSHSLKIAYPVYQVNSSGICAVLGNEITDGNVANLSKYIIYRTSDAFISVEQGAINDVGLGNGQAATRNQDFTLLDNGFGWFQFGDWTWEDTIRRMITLDAGKTWNRLPNNLQNIFYRKWTTYKPDCTDTLVPIMMEDNNGQVKVGQINLTLLLTCEEA